MKIMINKNTINIFVWYFLTTLILFSNISETSNLIRIPISTSFLYPFMLITILFLILLKIRIVKLDFLFLLLFLRFLLFTIGVFNHPYSLENFTRYLSSALWVMLYVFLTLEKGVFSHSKEFVKFVKFILFVICIQTCNASFYALNLGIKLAYIKNFIRIPIAPSNTITCYIILLIPFIYFLDKSKFKWFYLSLSIISILLTRSMSGILILIIMFIFILLKSKKNRIIKIISFSIIFLFSIIFIQYFIPDFFARYIEKFNELFNQTASVNNYSMNGRSAIYNLAIHLIKNSFPWGYGVSYSIFLNNQLAHNWILEALLQEGLLNLLITISIFITILIKIPKFNKNPLFLSTVTSVIFVLTQALVEPSITAFPFDFVFFSVVFIALGINYRNEFQNE